MAPSVDFTIWATPVFFCPAWLSAGQATVSPEPSFHAVGDALVRYFVKLLVVPDASARWAITTLVPGRDAPGLSAFTAASFHFLIVPPNRPANVSALSFRSF